MAVGSMDMDVVWSLNRVVKVVPYYWLLAASEMNNNLEGGVSQLGCRRISRGEQVGNDEMRKQDVPK